MYSNTSDSTENCKSDSRGDLQVTKRVEDEAHSPSVAVIEAVATATGRDSSDVPLLYEVIDPDALDALFAPRHDGTPRLTGEIHFTLAGCDVTVISNGDVIVHEPVTSPGQDSVSVS